MTSTETPQLLSLELTGLCQLRCVHCYAESSPSGTHGSMAVHDWRRVIDQGADSGVRRVQFIGGEPTLHPDLPELIDHALFRALGVEVFTNLVHVTPGLWTVFEQPGVSLATSYYSDDPAEHAAITTRPSHARTRANISEAVRRGIPIRAGVIDLGAGQRAEQARKELVGLGVPRVGYDRLRAFGRGARGGEQSATGLCGRCGDGRMSVDPNGSVRPCVFSRWADFGNVHEDAVADIASRLPGARDGLIQQGMPVRAQQGCDPDDCAPKGGECYPIND